MNIKNFFSYGFVFIFTITTQSLHAAATEPGYPLGKFKLKKGSEVFYATYVYPVDDRSQPNWHLTGAFKHGYCLTLLQAHETLCRLIEQAERHLFCITATRERIDPETYCIQKNNSLRLPIWKEDLKKLLSSPDFQAELEREK